MKIAITANNKKEVTAHAGGCRNYLIYTIENDQVVNKELVHFKKEQTLRYTFHDDKSEHPQNPIFDMDILLTGSIGQGAIFNLANQNVKAFIIEEKDPDLAVQKFLSGTLRTFLPHEHSHSCNH